MKAFPGTTTNPTEDPDVHYAPSLEIENRNLNISLEISAIDENEWHLFLRKTINPNAPTSMTNEFTIELTDQSEEDVTICLNAFLNVDLDYLDKTFVL